MCFDSIGRIAIGLQFMTSFESPLLYSGTTLAFSRDIGKCAGSILELNMLTMCGAMISALSLSCL